MQSYQASRFKTVNHLIKSNEKLRSNEVRILKKSSLCRNQATRQRLRIWLMNVLPLWETSTQWMELRVDLLQSCLSKVWKIWLFQSTSTKTTILQLCLSSNSTVTSWYDSLSSTSSILSSTMNLSKRNCINLLFYKSILVYGTRMKTNLFETTSILRWSIVLICSVLLENTSRIRSKRNQNSMNLIKPWCRSN